MEPGRTITLVLDCGLVAAASEVEPFWSRQEHLEDLMLRQVDGPPMRREYLIKELLTNAVCTHEPRCPVDHEEHIRAVLRLTQHRWNPECTDLALDIYPPSPNADGVFFPGKGCYPPFPEETLEGILEEFRAYLEREAVIQTPEVHLPSWVASERTRQEKHKPVYDLWLEMWDEYRQDVGFSDVVKPTKEALRERAVEELGITYSVRRLHTLIREGEEGYLK